MYFAYDAVDLQTETGRTRQKFIQAHKCLNNYLESGFVSDDSIKEAQHKIDKILYIEKNKTDYLDPFWDIHNEAYELVTIVADSNGCTRISSSIILHVANGIYIIIHNVICYTYKNSNSNKSFFIRIHV